MHQSGAKLFIIDLHYVVPLDVVDGLLPGHKEYLDQGYEDSVFLVSGRKEPRTGGVIIAADDSREAIERRVGRDPLVSHGAASVAITEVRPSLVSSDFDPRAVFGIADAEST